MSITVAEVHIWGEFAGAVAWDEDLGLATFEYHPEFKRLNWELSPLKMPITSTKSIFSFPELRKIEILHTILLEDCPTIADALPDNYGNQLINMYYQQGRPQNSMNPVKRVSDGSFKVRLRYQRTCKYLFR